LEPGLLVGNVLSLQQPVEEKRLPTPPNADSMLEADSELLAGCRSGSLPAFERLYSVHGARMKSIALNLLGNVADAEDAVQEAFIKIYRGIGGFKGRSAFYTWIYRILVNACHDMRRKRQRRQEQPELGIDPVGLNFPAPCAVDHPLRLTLESHLARLNPRSRTVFLLFEVEGFKHREISQILKIPEGTSKNLLFEAKRELQRLLWRSRTSQRSDAL